MANRALAGAIRSFIRYADGTFSEPFNGLNNYKMVSGYFTDSAGIHHGFIGKVHE
jgi:hypothetical protein